MKQPKNLLHELRSTRFAGARNKKLRRYIQQVRAQQTGKALKQAQARFAENVPNMRRSLHEMRRFVTLAAMLAGVGYPVEVRFEQHLSD